MRDPPSAIGQYLLVTCDLDPAATTIAGKSVFPMTFKDGSDVTPAWLTVTYRLTATPPGGPPGVGGRRSGRE